jgi:hypothetical protein
VFAQQTCEPLPAAGRDDRLPESTLNDKSSWGAKAISMKSVKEYIRGRKVEYGVPKEHIAEALDVGKILFSRAEQHVETSSLVPIRANRIVAVLNSSAARRCRTTAAQYVILSLRQFGRVV